MASRLSVGEYFQFLFSSSLYSQSTQSEMLSLRKDQQPINLKTLNKPKNKDEAGRGLEH